MTFAVIMLIFVCIVVVCSYLCLRNNSNNRPSKKYLIITNWMAFASSLYAECVFFNDTCEYTNFSNMNVTDIVSAVFNIIVVGLTAIALMGHSTHNKHNKHN